MSLSVSAPSHPTAFRQLHFEDNRKLLCLVGSHDENLTQLEEAFGVSVIHRGSTITITGDNNQHIESATEILERFYQNLSNSSISAPHAFDELLQHWPQNTNPASQTTQDQPPRGAWCSIHTPKLRIEAQNSSQEHYLHAIHHATLTFGFGIAGCGKTFLAVAAAVAMLERGSIKRIVLTRPVREAGEQLGFLPGGIGEKLDPYLRPIYDALEEMLPHHTLEQYIENRRIEIAPLAFMRGRTLKNAFVLLDEAQNTTEQQMLMFLTRIGAGSKMVINGDPEQIDLPREQISGLVRAANVLPSDHDIRLIHFAREHSVRHVLIERIVAAFIPSE